MKTLLRLLLTGTILSLTACSPARGTPPGAPPGCGDGRCGGPETFLSCPLDCPEPTSPPPPAASSFPPPALTSLPPLAPTSPPAEIGAPDPINFFYAIHTHVSDPLAPYDASGAIDAHVAGNILAAIEGIQQVLDRHGAHASWQVLPTMASGLCEYGGENHILHQLLQTGHEVGLHIHQTEMIASGSLALIEDCGIVPQVGSGHLLDANRAGESSGAQAAQLSIKIALERSIEHGITVINENLSPGGGKNPFDEACSNQFGIGNSMWEQTGNLLYPWRPAYQATNICAEDPSGEVVFIDQVSLEAILAPGSSAPADVFGTPEFQRLQRLLDEAIAYVQAHPSDRPAAWGFVTHIIEYAPGGRAEHPPDPASLAALDAFLTYVDEKAAQGFVVYATPAEIAALVH